MPSFDVDARYDDSRPEGGHAVVLIAGLTDLEAPVLFKLRPLDADLADDSITYLMEPHAAIAVRQVDGGSEIVIGPLVTEHPALQAGSIVEIELPGHGLRSEMIWPSIVPVARPRRTSHIARRVGTAPRNGVAPVAAPSEPSRSAEPPRPTPAAASLPARIAARATRPVSKAPEPAKTPAPIVAHSITSELPRSHQPEFAPEEIPPMTTNPPLGSSPHGDARPDEAERDDYVVFYPHARGGKLQRTAPGEHRQRPALLPTSPLGAAVASAIAVLGLVWLVTGGLPGNRPMTIAPSVAPTVTAPATPTAAIAAPRPPDAVADGSIYDLLAAGTASPRGIAGRDMSGQKALEHAHAAFNTPGAPRDTEEGAYWLRRYVQTIGNDERTRRALTQLGSALADSSNRNFDFGKARQAWELASAFGDPVAMCFLGTLHENGIVGAVDRRLALTWYERSKQAGGCPGIDDAIARVRS